MKYLIIISILVTTLSINAEVITDGTLGQQINLQGNNFQITPDLGQQHGGNLFHSFQEFNINSSESAIFSGPNSVQNIFSRVTGGNPSNIDGLIRSTIPNADMYFLNPYGIMFGPNARLDIQGSFHASTADYLKLGENGRFAARNPNNSVLTVAPIESFGFLDNPHGKIEIVGQRTDLDNPQALLQVPDGKNLSLIGGEIYLSQNIDKLPLEKLSKGSQEEFQAAYYQNQRFSQIYAPGGTINLMAIKQAGEVKLNNTNNLLGNIIKLEQQAFISTAGENGGNVFISAGQFVMDNSNIYSRTLGKQNGGIVDIQANNIELTNFSKIVGGTENTGDGTDIKLTANESISLIKDSPLNTEAGNNLNINQTLGDAGNITLQAKDITVETVHFANGNFASNTYGSGQGGNISFIANDNLYLNDLHMQSATSGNDNFAGNGGDVYLQANNLRSEASHIRLGSNGTGVSGNLIITAGQFYLGKVSKNGDGGSWWYTIGRGQGNSGHITIQADDMLLEDGAAIMSSNYGDGNSGNIDIQIKNQFTLRGADGDYGYGSGLLSSNEISGKNNAGDAGNINISANAITIKDGGNINASSRVYSPLASAGKAGNIILNVNGTFVLSGVNPYGENIDGLGSNIASSSLGNSGNAGNIQIQADSIAIANGAFIETNSDNSSQGGDIKIQADKYIKISGDASQITFNKPAWSQNNYLSTANPETYNQSISGIYASSRSKDIDSGNSGNIELSTSQLTLNQKGQISTASQGGGEAGKITLNVNKLTISKDSLIHSNSNLSNQFNFDSATMRDERLINTGTVVKTLDTGEGKAIYQINLGQTLINLIPVTNVADITALEQLPEQVILNRGDMVVVENMDNGQPTTFVYIAYQQSGEVWSQVNNNPPVILENTDSDALNSRAFVDGAKPYYQDGTKIHVNDVGNGKSADFIYTLRTPKNPELKWIRSNIYRVQYYQVDDITALQNLVASTDLLIGTQIDVAQAENGNSARFVFDGNELIRFGQIQEVPDIRTRENLVLAKAGHIANLPTGNTIYTGNEWINLGKIYRVNNLAERDTLNIKHGDLVKVADVGNGHHDAFLYADGQWIKQIRGGNAGQIVINADKIQVSDGSEISTASVSGGGGSVTLNVDNLVYLNNGQISTSVQEGSGSGGNLIISKPQFVTMNNGKIIAQANEGSGGNIDIHSERFISSPNSLVSASSNLGLDGKIQIESVDVDMEGDLVILQGKFAKATDQMKKTCNLDGSTFKVQKLNGSSKTPYDYQAAQYLTETDDKVKTAAKKSGKKLAFLNCKTNHVPNN